MQIDQVAPAFVTMLARVRTRFDRISLAASSRPSSMSPSLPFASTPTKTSAALVDIRLPARRRAAEAGGNHDGAATGKAALPNASKEHIDFETTIAALEGALAEV